jgi:hypothetical protein
VANLVASSFEPAKKDLMISKIISRAACLRELASNPKSFSNCPDLHGGVPDLPGGSRPRGTACIARSGVGRIRARQQPFQKFRGTEFRALGASVDNGPNVKLSLTPSLFEDVFWRLRHLIYPSLSARARLRVSRSADHFEADRQLPSGVHFAPNKEQNKRTDNRHDETGR